MLKDYFDGRDINKQGHPDEDVALGAARLGSMIAKGQHLTF